MNRTCIAVSGPGDGASRDVLNDATVVGRLIAERGWVLLTGGRDAGVMRAATEGAAAAGGLTVGILPDADRRNAAPDLTVALATGLGEARNAVLITAADAVIACGMNPGTASEVALALRANKPTVLVRSPAASTAFFTSLGALRIASSPQEAIEWVSAHLS
jgi:uncharacterized protein (TIGR00725 family)